MLVRATADDQKQREGGNRESFKNKIRRTGKLPIGGNERDLYLARD